MHDELKPIEFVLYEQHDWCQNVEQYLLSFPVHIGTPLFSFGSFCLVFSFMCGVLYTVVCFCRVFVF